MGTTFTIYLYAPNQAKADEELEASFDEIERVEEALSNYRESSELSRINRLAAITATTTDPEVFKLLQTSFDYSRRSDGAFDITVGPLMRTWGFFKQSGHYPTSTQLSHARWSVGWNKVKLDPAQRTVEFDVPGMELDMGGIGKGYAVDRVIDILRDAGVKAALVDAGSSTLYALGAPPGKEGWKVIVPRPADRLHAVSEVVLRNNSLSTSGSYEKFFRLNGRTYCHIMDPRTGEPVQGTLQTTVIAPTGTASDALSTAMFVMGPTAGGKLLESMPNTSAIWITNNINEPHFEQWHWPGRLCRTADHCVTAGEGNGTR
ncbi:MAG TPA: FAD:protein FMN transferase [Terriglobales bacterium]|nr:FAD:protein FMN transferase [Terriglobales bacterium]